MREKERAQKKERRKKGVDRISMTWKERT